jgi:transcriptional regulator with XRE-family HTH domain
MARKQSFFARRLRELRDKAGLSQGKLAQRCDLGLSTIAQFEQGLREPTYGTLVTLAKGLGVSLVAFEEAEGEAPAKKPEESTKKPQRPPSKS